MPKFHKTGQPVGGVAAVGKSATSGPKIAVKGGHGKHLKKKK